MSKRTIFYLSKMILGQLEKGEDYSELNKTITINILNFDYLDGENFIKSYGLFEKNTKASLTDLIEIIFIELPKFNKMHKDYNDRLHKWLTFLANPSGKEIEELVKSDENIKEAMDILYEISGDKETKMLADMREKALMDEQSRLKGAKEEGIEEGAIEMAIKLLTKKFKELPSEVIFKIKGLTGEKAEAIVIDIFDIDRLEDLERYF